MSIDAYTAAKAATPPDVLEDLWELDDSLTRWLAVRLQHFADIDQHVTDRDFNSGDPEGSWHGELLMHMVALRVYSERDAHAGGSTEDRVAYYVNVQEAAKDALRWVANNLERLWI